MSPEWDTNQNEGIHVLFESTRKFLHSTERITMSREGNRDTLKSCLSVETERETQSVTFFVLKRELESVKRKLRNLKNGQQENRTCHK